VGSCSGIALVVALGGGIELQFLTADATEMAALMTTSTEKEGECPTVNVHRAFETNLVAGHLLSLGVRDLRHIIPVTDSHMRCQAIGIIYQKPEVVVTARLYQIVAMTPTVTSIAINIAINNQNK